MTSKKLTSQTESTLENRSKDGTLISTLSNFNAFPLLETELTNDGVELRDAEDRSFTPPTKPYRTEIVWRNVVAMALVHLFALYGFGCLAHINNATFWYFLVLLNLATIGSSPGAHRLWAHRSYKAKPALKYFLAYCFLMALQNDLHTWVRDHRAHHKFAETDADPHNIRRGFFFSHVGWILSKKHPEVKRRGATIDMSDMEAEPMVMFMKRWYMPLGLLVWGIIPAAIPIYGWGEDPVMTVAVCVFTRYFYTLTSTWLANSWSHMWGKRPYDRRLGATESIIRHFLTGEGFHNYHHAFPWDYSASELGASEVFNPMTAVINLFAWLGLAYDLKKADQKLIQAKAKSKGLEKVNYREHSGLREWVFGTMTLYSPIFVTRWVLMLIYNV